MQPMNRPQPTAAMRLILFAVLLCGLVGSSALTLAAPARQISGDYQVFMPVVMRPQGTPPPPPPPLRAAFFMEPGVKTGSADIQTDAQGGLHLAYAYYLPDEEDPAAVYRYCPPTSDCNKPANWNGVVMGSDVNEVQLALTPAGQPRVFFRTTSQDYGDVGNDFYFAACDQSCTDPAQWEFTYVLTNYGTAIYDVNDRITPQHSFTLDPQGRPRFIYQDRNHQVVPNHLGAYYVFCDVDCANPQSQWFEVRISEETTVPLDFESFERPSLAFTASGQPRVVANVYTLDDDDQGVYYLACDDECGYHENWGRVRLFDRGAQVQPAWDVELTANDQPRLAFYEGGQINSQGENLFYAWCNGNCLTFASWHAADLGLGRFNGQGPDLELDAQNRPRIAYMQQSGDGLGYAWCNTACESPQAQWQHQTLETAAKLAQEFPAPVPSWCKPGLWDSLAPMLTLNSTGNPRIAYDSKYEAYCLYDDPTDGQPPYYRFEEVWHVVRVVLTPQP